MLLELAIGDAYGAGFEFAAPIKVDTYNDVSQYCAHELGVKPGHYTDDTQMSLAIAELLLAGSEWTAENIAQQFVTCFKRDQRPGYAKGFYQFLQSVDTGAQFLDRIKPKSTRNGAAMRAAPLGYIRDIDQLMAVAGLQASITHNTDIGIKSSQAVALAAHYMHYQLGSKNMLCEFISQYTQHPWQTTWDQPVACCAEETVNALLSVWSQANSLKDILKRSVDFTGDVDTVAAVGLGVASLSPAYHRDLPKFLYTELENADYGKDYLSQIDQQLSEAF